MKKQYFPAGSKDVDSEERAVAPNNHRRMQNMRFNSTDAGDRGSAVNLKSTLLISNPAQDPNAVCFGEAENKEDGSKIRFSYNPTGDFVDVFRHYPDSTDTDELIMRFDTVPFGYIPGERVTHAVVVDGRLIWTYRDQPIRAVSIDKVYRFNQSGGADPLGYSDFDIQTVDAAPYPPKFAPDAFLSNDGSRSTNFISEVMAQFMYRYVYEDGSKSTFSHYSRLVTPDSSWDKDGRVTGVNGEGNAIQITVNTGHHTVDFIEVALRNRNEGNWFIFKTIDKQALGLADGANYTFQFYNDEARTAVPTDELNNFTAMPITAFAQAYTNEKFLVWGDYVTGQDKPDPDITLTPSKELIDFGQKGDVELRMVLRNFNNTGAQNEVDANDLRVAYGYIVIKDVPPAGSRISFKYSSRTTFVGSWPDNTGVHDIEPEFTKVFDDGTNLRFVDDVIGDPVGSGTQDSNDGFPFDYVVTSDDVDGGVLTLANNLKTALDESYETFRQAAQNTPTYGTKVIDDLAEAEVVTYAVASPLFWNTDTNPDDYTGAYVVKLMNDSNYPTITNGGPGGVSDSCSTIIGMELSGYDDSFTTGFSSPLPPVEFQGPGQPNYYRKQLDFTVDGGSRTLKSGSFIKLGLNYFDNVKRDCSVVLDTGINLYIPWYTEDPDFATLFQNATLYRNVIDWQIRHLPPEWATSYCWVFQGSSNIRNWQQRSITFYSNQFNGDDSRVTITLEGNAPTRLSGFTYGHTPEVGDIVRLAFRRRSGFDEVEVPPVYIEFTVLDIADTSNDPNEVVLVCNKPSLSDTVLNDNMLIGSLVEVFTPAPIDDELLYNEFSEEYDILNPGTDTRAHQGQTQDQIVVAGVSQQSATGKISEGDAYVRVRDMAKEGGVLEANTMPYVVEDPSFSDFFLSNSFSKGRVAVFSAEAKQLRKKASVLRGGKYFDNSSINRLYDVREVNEFPLSEEDGAIFGIRTRGFTVRIYQSRKVTSVYVNRDEVMYPDGTSQLVLIDRVLGTPRPSSSNYGCKNPESILDTGRTIVFWDDNNNTLVKDDLNGLVPIEIGMKSELNRVAGQSQVWYLTGFDRDRDEIIFCVRGILSSLANELCVGLSASSFEYKSDLPYRPDHFAELNNRIFSYIGGAIWEHEEGADYNVIYGSQVDAEWWIPVTPEIAKRVFFNNISIEASEAPNIYEILVDAVQDRIGTGMLSRLIPAKFENDQGVWFAPFLNNMNTPGLTPDQGLIYGSELEGNSMLIKFRFTTTNKVLISSFTIEYQDSMLTP